jgi:hypothetical protein
MQAELLHFAARNGLRMQPDILRDALIAAHGAGFVSSTERLVVRELLASKANGNRLPEQRVVAFKSLLHQAATEAGIPLGRDRTILLERFVSLFIEEMYRAESRVGYDDAVYRCRPADGSTATGNLEPPAARP